METNVYFGGLAWQEGAGKEPEDARGVLNFHQSSGGIDIHICKNIMCRSLPFKSFSTQITLIISLIDPKDNDN